jgi:CHAT domain
MSGIANPVTISRTQPCLELVVEKDSYSIGRWKFPRPSDPTLEMLTEEILNSFDRLRRAVIDSKNIKLDAELCNKHLREIAEWGQTAYQEFFGDEKPSRILASRLTPNAAPTFVSELTPFLWEVLYEGNEGEYKQGNPERFWGFRYTPARILNPEKDITDYASEQSSHSDMLFCLHHKLRYSHQEEHPEIERIVRNTHHDRFSLLGNTCDFACDQNALIGDDLLKYIYKARHNMLHFACHCRRTQRGDDSLLVSFIRDEMIEDTAQVIELETYKFSLRGGQFIYPPLVFLNACQSAGGTDDLRRTFNLPKVFIKRGAAAVIATACPVPDAFAAAFAKVFYRFFLQGAIFVDEETGKRTVKLMSIGEALRATRWFFLKEYNNPLGLAYGLYSPAHYRLAQPSENLMSNASYSKLLSWTKE